MFPHFPLMPIGLIFLIISVGVGLNYLGLSLPHFLAPSHVNHAFLMVGGFFGTLITLERAMALRKWWGYLAPSLTCIAGLLMISGADTHISAVPLILGSLFYLFLLSSLYLAHRSFPIFVMTAGGMLWAGGNILFIFEKFRFTSILLWMGWFLFTITAERIELTKLAKRPRGWLFPFHAGISLFILSTIPSFFKVSLSYFLAGFSLTLLGLWLLKYDIAIITIKEKGLTRFISLCLLPGYIWLIIGGAFSLLLARNFPVYDMFLHSVFLGFVFSMIFGHAPLIFPALMNIKMEFTPLFYIHLALLHGGLLMRALGNLFDVRLIIPGAILNALSIIVFLLNTLTSVMRTKLKEKR